MTTETTAATAFAIDPAHSSAEFAVKHMMIATVRGRFRDLEGAIHLDDADPSRSFVEATIDAASVATDVDMRDNHLRSDDFLAVERFPRILFRSTAVEPQRDDRWLVHGDLTIRSVTHPVTLDTELEGRGTGFEGEDRVGFSAHTTLSRKDFGLEYNQALETGGVVVGDKVKVTLHIEAARPTNAPGGAA